MCTLSVAFRVFPDAPVVVGANRDERLDRASTPPTAWPEEPGIVAPRDGEAGGTWIGYNDAGLLVAVANRWLETDLPSDRSRGLLVRDALRCETADGAARLVETELRSSRYAGFNLLVADATNAVLLEWDGRLRATPLEPGLHVVMNAGFDDRFSVPEQYADAGERQLEAARSVRRRLEPTDGESATDWLDRAAGVLGDHSVGVCVHDEEFGTRSSSLIVLWADGTATYRFAPGPPCETPYERVETVG